MEDHMVLLSLHLAPHLIRFTFNMAIVTTFSVSISPLCVAGFSFICFWEDGGDRIGASSDEKNVVFLAYSCSLLPAMLEHYYGLHGRYVEK